jgi:hypothetical protein
MNATNVELAAGDGAQHPDVIASQAHVHVARSQGTMVHAVSEHSRIPHAGILGESTTQYNAEATRE